MAPTKSPRPASVGSTPRIGNPVGSLNSDNVHFNKRTFPRKYNTSRSKTDRNLTVQAYSFKVNPLVREKVQETYTQIKTEVEKSEKDLRQVVGAVSSQDTNMFHRAEPVGGHSGGDQGTRGHTVGGNTGEPARAHTEPTRGMPGLTPRRMAWSPRVSGPTQRLHRNQPDPKDRLHNARITGIGSSFLIKKADWSPRKSFVDSEIEGIDLPGKGNVNNPEIFATYGASSIRFHTPNNSPVPPETELRSPADGASIHSDDDDLISQVFRMNLPDGCESDDVASNQDGSHDESDLYSFREPRVYIRTKSAAALLEQEIEQQQQQQQKETPDLIDDPDGDELRAKMLHPYLKKGQSYQASQVKSRQAMKVLLFFQF